MSSSSTAANLSQANDRGDSWVEVSSQPSDSYTSSSSSTENIVITEGLRVQNQARRRAARKARREAATLAGQKNVARQDKMDKSPTHHQSSSEDLDEHEGDDISDTNLDSMGSSIADLPSLSEGFDDEDESSTGGESSEDETESNKGKQTNFQNDDNNNRAVPGHSRMTTAFASSSSRPAQPARLHSFSRAPPQPDHDAALRASLSTLLSCAAATRALPKPRSEHAGRSNLAPPRGAPHIQTLTLMTDEQREAMMDFMASTPATRHVDKQEQDANSSAQKTISSPAVLKSRRTSVTEEILESQPEQRKSAQHRKHKSSTNSSKGFSSVIPLTPSNVTYVTLAVSAAAVLLVSAISFSAGYHIGKEVGRGEFLNLSSEGQDLVRRAATETMSRAGGRIVLGSGMSGNLRSISVR